MSETMVDPRIHAGEPHYPNSSDAWVGPETGDRLLTANPRPFRHCNYCGSIHPDDLLVMIDNGDVQGAVLANMKYGYPHKVYITARHPRAGEAVVVGSRYDNGVTTPIMGRESTITAKFYTTHLTGVDDDTFTRLDTWLQAVIGVRMIRDDAGQLRSWHRCA